MSLLSTHPRPRRKRVRGALLAAVLLGLVAQWPIRFDVTEDRRHSLSQATEAMLEDIAASEDEVLVRCYLEGDFPARYQRLAEEIRSKLRTFARKSGNQVRWQFVDVTASGDDKTIGETERALYDQGLRFTRIATRENGVTAFQNVWPCAIATVGGVDYPVQFRGPKTWTRTKSWSRTPSTRWNSTSARPSVLGLRDRRPSVGMLQGHGCWLLSRTADFTTTLSGDGRCRVCPLDGAVDACVRKSKAGLDRQPKFDVLIVAGPDLDLDRDDKLLDQYLMNGATCSGSSTLTDRDSLREAKQTPGHHLGNRPLRPAVPPRRPAQPRHGPRCPVRPDCPERRADGQSIEHADVQLYFAPVVLPWSEAHPICANLDPVHFDFTSSLDPVNALDGRESRSLPESSV